MVIHAEYLQLHWQLVRSVRIDSSKDDCPLPSQWVSGLVAHTLSLSNKIAITPITLKADQSHRDQIKIPHCRPCRSSQFHCYRCQLLVLSLDMHLPGIPCHPFSQTALLGAGVQNQMVLFWDGVCAYLIIVTGTTGGARVNPVPVPV